MLAQYSVSYLCSWLIGAEIRWDRHAPRCETITSGAYRICDRMATMLQPGSDNRGAAQPTLIDWAGRPAPPVPAARAGTSPCTRPLVRPDQPC
jgi:hypothetical protein